MYGVDQCRVCGTSIVPTGREARAKQEEANRHPLIPEKQWRAMGLLTAPTRAQLGAAPADGCCRPCGLKMMKRKYKYGVRRIIIISFMVAAAGFVMWVTTYLPH